MELNKLKEMVKPLNEELQKQDIYMVVVNYYLEKENETKIFAYGKNNVRVNLDLSIYDSLIKASKSLYFKILVNAILTKQKKEYKHFKTGCVRFCYMVDCGALNIYCCGTVNDINQSVLINL